MIISITGCLWVTGNCGPEGVTGPVIQVTVPTKSMLAILCTSNDKHSLGRNAVQRGLKKFSS